MNISILLIVVTILALMSIFITVFSQSKQQESKKILFLRHGSRSPDIFIFHQLYWNQYDRGCLTVKGFQQMKKLGEYYQKDTMTSTSGQCIYEKMNLLSSTKQRAVMSTIGFITGLCPNNYGEILRRFFKEYFSQYTVDLQEFEKIIASDFKDPFTLNFSTFENPQDFVFQGNVEEVCPLTGLIMAWIQSQNEYIKKQEKFRERPEYDEIVHQMQKYNPDQNYTERNGKNPLTITMMKDFYGSFLCNQAEGLKHPKLSKKSQNLLLEIYLYLEYNVLNSFPEQHKAGLSEMAKLVIKDLYDDIPLSIFSAHDATLISIFSVLIDDQIYPQFASNLELSIQGDQVNFYYLGKQLKTKICSSGLNCTIQEVVTYLHQFIVEDIKQFCRLP